MKEKRCLNYFNIILESIEWNAFKKTKTFRLLFLLFIVYFFSNDDLREKNEDFSRKISLSSLSGDSIYKLNMGISKAYMEFIKSIFIETLQL